MYTRRIDVLLIVVSVFVVSTWGCYQQCAQQFNQRLTQAAQGGMGAASLQQTCDAISAHLICLRAVQPTCPANQRTLVDHITTALHNNYTRLCTEGLPPSGPDMTNCGARYMDCKNTFNATFFPALNTFNLTSACGALNNYTGCVEGLLALPGCSQYANHAVTTINGIRARYASTCQGDTDQKGAEMARCMQGTLDCVSLFNTSFFPSVKQSNMTLLCSAVSNYSDCVMELANDASCQQYTAQAVSSVQMLQQQHQGTCAQDGGQLATECLQKFKECYSHFNETFNPAVKEMNIDKLCGSMDEYKACSAEFPTECEVHLGQSMDNLDRMQAQYTQYCTTENKKIFSCTALSQCNRALIGNLTMSPSEAGMLCKVLEWYFPCVYNSVGECQLSGDGVPAVSFRDLGILSSRYCRSVLATPSIKSCVNFMQCHAALDLTNMSPSAMVEGTYWCSYMQSSLMCSSQLISAGQCFVQNRNDMLNNIRHLQQMATSTCTLPPPDQTTTSTSTESSSTASTAPTTKTPTTAEVSVTTEKDDTKKDDTKKDDKKKDKDDGKKDTSKQKPRGSAAVLDSSLVTLTLLVLTSAIMQRH